MGNLSNHDTTGVDPRQDFDILPAGPYKVAIINSGFQPTKAQDGEFLEIEMEILEGDCKGQHLWDRLNLVNKSIDAVSIAKRTLVAIKIAVGKPRAEDSSELHNIPLGIKVKVKKAEPEKGWDESNEIKAYTFADFTKVISEQAGAGGGGGEAASASASPTSRPSAGGGGKPPWAKKK